MQADPQQTLAVFDLDGTLTRGDSLLPFLIEAGRRLGRYYALGRLPIELALYAIRVRSDRSAKQKLLQLFLGGHRREVIEPLAEKFALDWVKTRPMPVGMERLRYHQGAGHRVILVSASPDVYVVPLAKELGIAEVVCTRVGWQADVCLGTLTSPNCKGEAKVSMLQEYLGTTTAPRSSFGYGDSPSDLPLLRWVVNSFLLAQQGKYLVPVLREA
jgi:HAD superfamily hydrolase (TIGR01490 family)